MATTTRGKKKYRKKYAKKTGDRHSEISKKILEAIEAGGVGKFEMPWHRQSGRPINALTRKAYRGTNTLVLWMHGVGVSSNEWGTYLQWQQVGGQVSTRAKGKGVTIVYYRPRVSDADEVERHDDENSKRMVRVSHTVFNRDYVDGLPPVVREEQDTERPEKIASVEKYLEALKGDVRVGGERAFYSPKEDYIQMPSKDIFKKGGATERWYSTLCHEYAHWSGHTSRLDRFSEGNYRFGDKAYAAEELVADISAAFLCADLGIDNEPREDHAAYIASWMKRLTDTPSAYSEACREAEEVVNYLHGLAGFEIDSSIESEKTQESTPAVVAA